MRPHASALRALLTVTGLFAAAVAYASWPHDPTANVPACAATGNQTNLVSCPDGAGGMILAWEDYRSGTARVYAQRIDAAGNALWGTDGIAVCTAAGAQTNPAICRNAEGGAFVVWQDRRSGSIDLWGQSLHGNYGSRSWSDLGAPICTAGGEEHYATLIPAQDGGAFVAWSDSRFSAAFDIYANRFWPWGLTWWGDGGNGVPICSANDAQLKPVLAATGDDVIVAWWDLRDGVSLDLYAQRAGYLGATQWTTNGVLVCNAQNDQRDLQIVADDVGGAIMVWGDERNGFGNSDIYSQRVSATGQMRWTTNGVALTTASGQQTLPKLVSDAAGGAIVVWQDHRGATWDVYANRVTSQGTVPWAPGVGLCTAIGDQTNPALVADGAGGAIVAWEDRRAGAADVYAQRVQGTGIWRWQDQGNLVCAAANDQLTPLLVSDGGSGAIVAWKDGRPGNATPDVYAQRIERFGWLGNPEPRIVSVLDVPADEGGQVRVTWNASWTDVDPFAAIQEYRVWRSVPAGPQAEALAVRRGTTTDPDEAAAKNMLLIAQAGATTYAWELAGATEANGAASYQLAVATTADSIPGSSPRTYFMVQARTTSPPGYPYWYSAPDSGTSVDNLPPARPQGFAVRYQGALNVLHWLANTEPDLAGYRIYRGNTSTFTPAPPNRIAEVNDTTYTDPYPAQPYYKILAFDIHGNESVVAIAGPPSTAVDERTTAALFLAAPAPNPARETTSLRWTLPSAARVKVAVYDLAGRLVRMVHDGPAAAGEHVRQLALADAEGRSLASGIYVVRLESDGLALTRRLVTVR